MRAEETVMTHPASAAPSSALPPSAVPPDTAPPSPLADFWRHFRANRGALAGLVVFALAVLLSAIPGVALGLLAAFRPKVLGPAILRLMDIMLALPSLLLAIAVVAVLGPGLFNTMIAIAMVSLPSYVRLVRASAMGELAKDYVTASRLAGAGTGRLMLDTVLPNCLAPVIVTATMGFSDSILTA